MSFEMTALLLTWVAIGLLALVVAGLVRQVHALTAGTPAPALGLRPGSPAPAAGRFGGPALMLFLSDDCGSCVRVLREVVATEPPMPVHVIFGADALDAPERDGVLIYPNEEELFKDYEIPATPFAVVVDGAGRVRRSEPVGSPDVLRELMRRELMDGGSSDRTRSDRAASRA